MMHGIFFFLILVAYEETEKQKFEAFSQSSQIQREEGRETTVARE